MLTTPELPGPVWAHFSAIQTDGYATLKAGRAVEANVEDLALHDQDGYRFRAVSVRP